MKTLLKTSLAVLVAAAGAMLSSCVTPARTVVVAPAPRPVVVRPYPAPRPYYAPRAPRYYRPAPYRHGYRAPYYPPAPRPGRRVIIVR
ncbi:hypothetical protein D3Y59_09650 [Hymenobacter oligotrophus]|uniref:Lipoprotein n=1 Tax=Hymenobacter oligotrophus TaxID=2319843 RepID=A0A3B7R0L0_9BACT|nr:hypothetical protein [Hymenobacter oligotrophus]AYA37292.1 hypothetical protein D3Y59_09650 [Hymenobacter oligotrophus]